MKRVPLMISGLLLMLIVLSSVAWAAEGPTVTTIATGFNVPNGVLVHPDGSVWVSEAGVPGTQMAKSRNFETGQANGSAAIGNSSRVIRIAPNGTRTVEANLPTILVGQILYGAHHLVLLNGAVYVPTTAWADYIEASRPSFAGTVVKIEGGKVQQAADLFAFENTYNPDGFHKESDPYGIAKAPDGSLYVTEAGANDLLKIDPVTGHLSLVAVFGGMWSPLPNSNRNGQMATDPVPTGVDVGKDGNIYVGFLTGVPFLPGTAKVVQVTPEGKVTNYATGLSTITALRFGPDGNLYATSFGQFTAKGPVPHSGMLLRIKPGNASEVVVDGMDSPAALDFNQAGDAYVAIKSWGGPGAGEIVRYNRLTSRVASHTVATTSNENTAVKQTSWIAPNTSAVLTPSLATINSTPFPRPWLLALAFAVGAVIGVVASFAWKRFRSMGY